MYLHYIPSEFSTQWRYPQRMDSYSYAVSLHLNLWQIPKNLLCFPSSPSPPPSFYTVLLPPPRRAWAPLFITRRRIPFRIKFPLPTQRRIPSKARIKIHFNNLKYEETPSLYNNDRSFSERCDCRARANREFHAVQYGKWGD